MSRLLVVTNDFPPDPGGIEAFVHGVVSRLPADEVVVYASAAPGAAAFDQVQPFPVIRDRAGLLLPTPRIARSVAAVARAERCDAVWFGAAAPLALLAREMRRRAGIGVAVATTHGHEVSWSSVPAGPAVLRWMGRGLDVMTYLGEYTHRRLARALRGAVRLERLTPGVDPSVFRPDPAAREEVRRRLGLGDRPVVVCVSRLVPRKGQDVLVEALPLVQRAVPDAALLVVGDGYHRRAVERVVRETGMQRDVVLTGSTPWADLPAYFAAGDVFAMPCRTGWRGLDVEGLGIVYLEASATGLPVVAGDSGGAPDAVVEGETGYVVRGGSVDAVAAALVRLLRDPALARTMGDKGRSWVEREWGWEQSAARLRGWVTSPPAG